MLKVDQYRFIRTAHRELRDVVDYLDKTLLLKALQANAFSLKFLGQQPRAMDKGQYVEKEQQMKWPSAYLKMRVLGAIESAEGKTLEQRIKNTAQRVPFILKSRCETPPAKS